MRVSCVLCSSPRQYAPARPVSLNALIGARVLQVRAAAEVGEPALRVEADRPLGGVDELDLVRLALGLEAGARLVRRDVAARPLAALGELAPDLVLDPLEVGLVDRLRELEVVVEAVLDRRPDRDLDAGVQAAHGLGEQVRARVPEDPQRVRVVLVADGQDLDRLPVGEREPQVLDRAVRAHEHRLLGELRPDRARGVEPGRAVGELELGAVGEDDLHALKDTQRPGRGLAAPRAAARTPAQPDHPTSRANPRPGGAAPPALYCRSYRRAQKRIRHEPVPIAQLFVHRQHVDTSRYIGYISRHAQERSVHLLQHRLRRSAGAALDDAAARRRAACTGSAGAGGGCGAGTSARRSCSCSARSRATATSSCRSSSSGAAAPGGRAPARCTPPSSSSPTRGSSAASSARAAPSTSSPTRAARTSRSTASSSGRRGSRPARTCPRAVRELGRLLGQVAIATRQVMQAGNAAQAKEASQILADTRRALYRILAEE